MAHLWIPLSNEIPAKDDNEVAVDFGVTVDDGEDIGDLWVGEGEGEGDDGPRWSTFGGDGWFSGTS